MSKAFTREDDLPEQTVLPRPVPSLPPGVKNYITAAGAKKLREELDHLLQADRPSANSPDDLRRERQILDQRIAYLHESLQSAIVVERPADADDKIRFGATVTVRDKAGSELQYRIVGIDEMDIDCGWVSWRSPIAKALLNARVGQRVKFQIPSGEEQLEIISVTYE